MTLAFGIILLIIGIFAIVFGIKKKRTADSVQPWSMIIIIGVLLSLAAMLYIASVIVLISAS